MKKKYIIILLLLILIALILLLIDKSTYKEYSKIYFYMDTYITVKLNTTKDKKEVDSYLSDIDYLYSTYHNLTDKYNEYDNIINVYYLNEILPNNEEIEIDSRLSDIINLGITYYNKTDGLFNIASSNLTSVWKDFIDTCDVLPTTYELNGNININDITLNNNIYTKTNDVKLDLGAIAKGYTTELVGNYLESKGITSYIINAGGNVKVGSSYNKDYYLVGVTDPNDTSDIFIKLKVNNLSVVTSGNYQRYCLKDNVNYNHIINPYTKYPSNNMKSVTVVSSSSTIADIYSTYLYLLTVEEGKEVVNNTDGIEAVWYTNDNEIVKSDNFNYE